MVNYDQWRKDYADNPEVLALIEHAQNMQGRVTHWQETSNTFENLSTQQKQKIDDLLQRNRELSEEMAAAYKTVEAARKASARDIQTLQDNRIADGGVCPTCGQARPLNPRLN